MNNNKYQRQYFMPPTPCYDWTKKEYIEKAPQWCSVDLRDGNQALVIPMSLDEKLEYFKALVKIGFKEIEVGFPAASETEFAFCRKLIEDNLIPDDVSIQVLTQSRKHIIERTFDALKGCKNAVVHLYNSTSVAQREQVFKKSKEEILNIAVDGAKLLLECSKDIKGNFRFEYSPESFTGTEVEFAAEVCNAVIDIWKPTSDKKVIINLPVTVEHSMPHIYACQVEYMCKNLKNRENVIVSLHPHNDRGCAVSDSELGILAGADRIEGTLFGNGERTGNVDLVTLAMNMYTHGVDPKLDLSNLPEITKLYEKLTRMHVYERQPYSGELVFAAFSGSHQDAIAKGMDWREKQNCKHWSVPYLPIDPKDLGREYDGDVIRINSQSGKGGIGYLLEQKYGYNIPKKMREDLGYAVKDVSDNKHKEIMPDEVLDIFLKRYVNIENPLKILEISYDKDTQIQAQVKLTYNEKEMDSNGSGNGSLDAVSNALKKALNKEFSIIDYAEHSLGSGSHSKACCYVGIEVENKIYWGSGVHTDIMNASVSALISAINRSFK